jgi:hypothetical protein
MTKKKKPQPAEGVDTTQPLPAAGEGGAASAPWKGRKRSNGDAKESRFELRISAVDRVELDKRAKADGLTAGAYLRKLALGTAGARHKRRATVKNEAVATLLFQIGKIGTNVNQMSKWSNTQKLMPDFAALKAMQRDLSLMRDQLTEALGYDHQR